MVPIFLQPPGKHCRFINITDYIAVFVHNAVIRHYDAEDIAVFIDYNIAGRCYLTDNVTVFINNLAVFIQPADYFLGSLMSTTVPSGRTRPIILPFSS